jgi:hypothetical protein
VRELQWKESYCMPDQQIAPWNVTTEDYPAQVDEVLLPG